MIIFNAEVMVFCFGLTDCKEFGMLNQSFLIFRENIKQRKECSFKLKKKGEEG